MKVFLGIGLLLVTAFPAWAQTADVFVKGDGAQCWQDVRQIVHQRASDVTENNELKTLRVGHFSDMAGDMFLTIQALPEKNRKGEEGCRIYVTVVGSGAYSSPAVVVNDLSYNTRIANLIAAQAAAMQKDRGKM
jgi:hypothetical protein